REQAHGIQQVNIAVQQMDKVVQGNAEGAHDLAGAADRMSAQTHALKTAVEGLIRMAGVHVAAPQATAPKAPVAPKPLPPPPPATSAPKPLKKSAADLSKDAAEEFIPMNDETDIRMIAPSTSPGNGSSNGKSSKADKAAAPAGRDNDF